MAPYEAHDPATGCGLIVVGVAFVLAVLAVLAVMVALTRCSPPL